MTTSVLGKTRNPEEQLLNGKKAKETFKTSKVSEINILKMFFWGILM